MIFVFYPVNSPPPTNYLLKLVMKEQEPAEYVPVNTDGSVTKNVLMSKGDKLYVIHDESAMDKVVQSIRQHKPGEWMKRLEERSQLRGNW